MIVKSIEECWSKSDLRVAFASGAAAAIPIGHALVQPVTWTTMKMLEATGLDPMMQLLVGFPAAAIGVMGATTGLSVSAGAGYPSGVTGVDTQAGFQFHGVSSSRRLILWSAMWVRTQASQASGSTLFMRAVSMRV